MALVNYGFVGGRQVLKRIALLSLIVLLGACGGSQMAYFSEGGGGQTLSVVREQVYFGGPWQTALIVAATPRCQRRHLLNGFVADGFRMEVFRPEPGVFILNAGKQWYVTELQNCEFQAYKAAPPQPGESLGRFEASNGALEFVPGKNQKSRSGT